jgi:HPt (histidine-containing phosphotransfer) domain-containing protein
MASDPKICDLPAALARMGGNVALLKQLAEFCREDLPQYLARLKTAVAEGKPADVRHAAHSIKGMVVNFDATAAANAAQSLEQMGLANDLRDAEVVARTLDEEISRLLATLAVELAKM